MKNPFDPWYRHSNPTHGNLFQAQIGLFVFSVFPDVASKLSRIKLQDHSRSLPLALLHMGDGTKHPSKNNVPLRKKPKPETLLF